MRTIIKGALGAIIILAGCSAETDSGASSTESTATEPPGCDTLIGLPTADVIAIAQCDDGTTIQLLGFASYDCPDGRQLSWNDQGWGYGDGLWQAHARPDGQLVPPQPDLDACGSDVG